MTRTPRRSAAKARAVQDLPASGHGKKKGAGQIRGGYSVDEMVQLTMSQAVSDAHQDMKDMLKKMAAQSAQRASRPVKQL